MYAKLKYIILTLLLIGIGLTIFNYTKLSEYESFSTFNFPIVLFSLLTIFFFLPRSLKMKSKKLTLTALGIGIIFLTTSAYTTSEYYESQRFGKILAEYSNLECDEMKEKFAADLKNNELKYSSGGMFSNETLSKNLKKNGIEEFYQGCIITVQFDCYKELLSEYLKKEKNVDLVNLY